MLLESSESHNLQYMLQFILLLVPCMQGPHMVDDVMTKGRIFSARVDTPVDDGALSPGCSPLASAPWAVEYFMGLTRI